MPNDIGRPSDYKPEYCQMLIDHMRAGYSFASFGAIVGCCEKTLHTWRNTHEGFLQAQNIGKAYSKLFWEDLGIKACTGKAKNLNSAVWIFNMKNRFGWKDKTETEVTGGTKESRLIIQFGEEQK